MEAASLSKQECTIGSQREQRQLSWINTIAEGVPMMINPGGDSLETQQFHLTYRTRPHAPSGSAREQCMRAVVVVFYFYCVVRHIPNVIRSLMLE